MREAMVRAARPARLSAQTVTAIPPAPAAPNTRVAACPAIVIS